MVDHRVAQRIDQKAGVVLAEARARLGNPLSIESQTSPVVSWKVKTVVCPANKLICSTLSLPFSSMTMRIATKRRAGNSSEAG